MHPKIKGTYLKLWCLRRFLALDGKLLIKITICLYSRGTIFKTLKFLKVLKATQFKKRRNNCLYQPQIRYLLELTRHTYKTVFTVQYCWSSLPITLRPDILSNYTRNPPPSPPLPLISPHNYCCYRHNVTTIGSVT